MTDPIRRILKEHARLSVDATTLADDADLYEAGLKSHARVAVMLALEEHFDVELPEHMLERSVFASVAALRAALDQLVAEKGAGKSRGDADVRVEGGSGP
jgi:acyl carrier protein